jgi:hypothetical protein
VDDGALLLLLLLLFSCSMTNPTRMKDFAARCQKKWHPSSLKIERWPEPKQYLHFFNIFRVPLQ